MHTNTHQHPANTIADAPDFPEALRRLEAALLHEGRVLADMDRALGLPIQRDAFWPNEAAKAREALHLYNETVAEAMRTAKMGLVATYRERGMTVIADALEADDLSLLAF